MILIRKEISYQKVKGYMICSELDVETTCEEIELVTLELSNLSSLLDFPFLGLNRVIIK